MENVFNDYSKSTENTYEEKHGDVVFLFRKALQIISEGKINHPKDLGYSEIVNFALPYDKRVLDLTWMNDNDLFCFDNATNLEFIDEVAVNIDNLGFSHFPLLKISDRKFDLTVDCNKLQPIPIRQIKELNYFLSKNSDYISKVNFKGLSPIMEAQFNKIVKKYISEEPQSSMKM